MILSHRWLGRHLVELPEKGQVVKGLEQLGIEVASVTSFGDDYAALELVEVVARTPHPRSDHLSLVDVRRAQGGVIRVVTGASNGMPGERVWYAPDGARLPDGRVLEVRDFRGISSPGMLLSPEEVGYQAYTGDLWIWPGEHPVGTTFLEAIGGLDTLYELELTPNIAQYLQSVKRIAEELASIWRVPARPPYGTFAYQNDPLAQVMDFERCPLYGLVKLHIVPGKASPLWMQTLLLAVGHRIIHPAVDVTNFVLWDLGEPLHAFDRRDVTGIIEVRRARSSEPLTLLDGTTMILDPQDLVIADQKGPLALAGIMGGQGAGIRSDTEEVLLESAHFSASGIFQSYKRHGLFTDAATHFGKGTDPQAVFEAPVMVTTLLQEAGILRRVGESILVGELPAQRTISLSASRIREILGVDWSDGEIQHALAGWKYDIVGEQVVVPRFRHDVDSLCDLAEDVARFYGMDRIPCGLPVGVTQLAERDPENAFYERIRDILAESGFNEVITRTFSNPEQDRLWLHELAKPAIQVTNPLREEERLMRRDLLGSLLEVVRYNRSRRTAPIRIFEVGPVFWKEGDGAVQTMELAVAMTLEADPAYPPGLEPSIYDLTGLLDHFAARLGWKVSRENDDRLPHYLHPGRAQRLVYRGETVGYVGEIRPRLALPYRTRRLGVLKLALDGSKALTISEPGKPSRFPEVMRDLSLVVPEEVSYGAIGQIIDAQSIAWLQSVRTIDRFQGDFGTSLTIRLTFQSPMATLTDSEVDLEVGRILKGLSALGVGLRQ